MNGDDREPANDSPLTDEVLKKYARAREVELFGKTYSVLALLMVLP